MSIDTRQSKGLSNEERAEVDKMLTALQHWVNLKVLCRDNGVREPKDIPIEVLRSYFSRIEEQRLRFLGSFMANSTSSPDEEEELDYRQEARLYLGPEDEDRQPLNLADIAKTSQEQKAIMSAVDQLKLKVNAEWAPMEVANTNLELFREEASGSTLATNDLAKIYTMWAIFSLYLQDELRNCGWLKDFESGDQLRRTYRWMVAVIKSNKKILTSQQLGERVIHRQEIKIKENETRLGVFGRVWKVGQDAWGEASLIWTPNQRRLLADCFEAAVPGHKARVAIRMEMIRFKSVQEIRAHIEELDYCHPKRDIY